MVFSKKSQKKNKKWNTLIRNFRVLMSKSSVWQLYSVIYCAAFETESLFSLFIYKQPFKFCTSRDVWMNLLSVNSGPEMVFVQNMHLSWFTIVENLVAHVEWDQVSYFSYFFDLLSTYLKFFKTFFRCCVYVSNCKWKGFLWCHKSKLL